MCKIMLPVVSQASKHYLYMADDISLVELEATSFIHI